MLPRVLFGAVLLAVSGSFSASCCMGAASVPSSPAAPGKADSRSEAPEWAPPPSDTTAGDAQQMAGLRRLQASSTKPVELRFARGQVRFASFDVAAPPESGAGADAVAGWFLGAYRDLLRLDGASELELVRRSRDAKHLVYRQLHHGIPVASSGVIVHLDGTHVRGLTGGYAPDIVVPESPVLTAREAERVATAGKPRELSGPTRLRYLSRELVGAGEGQFLTWRILFPLERVFVDARTGAVVHREREVDEGFDLDLETGNGAGPSPSESCYYWDFRDDDDLWFDGSGVQSSSADAEGWAANTAIHTVYDFWNGTLERDSYDGDGEDLEIYVHVGSAASWSAAWSQTVPAAHYLGGCCDFWEFSNGAVALDVMGHEFTHAVNHQTAELSRNGETGALNESFCDVFGYLVDPSDWRNGEALGRFRDLSHPESSTSPQPVSYASYDGTKGAHHNTGIPNKVAYLIIAGDDFNGRKIKGIGRTRAAHLYYDVLVNRLTSSAQMRDLRDAMVASAKDMVTSSLHGFEGPEVCAVQNAFAAVGLGTGDLDCDGKLDTTDDDKDGDGYSNPWDNCPELANPFQADVDKDKKGDACDDDDDGDGLADPKDNCPLVANKGQEDWDKDLKGDVCDDSDGDLVVDAKDLCPTVKDYSQLDTDKDKLGDACDDDDDNDRDLDGADNCPLVFNSNQEDQDGDRLGDACDTCPAVVDGTNLDTDEDGRGDVCDDDDDDDGVLDGSDNCPLRANDDQRDDDDDGVGYACDPSEQAAHIRELASRTPIRGKVPPRPGGLPVRLPVGGGGEPFPPELGVRLDLDLPAQHGALVRDDEGRVVAKARRGGGPVTLTFTPAAFVGKSSLESLVEAGGPRDLGLESRSRRYTLYVFSTTKQSKVPGAFTLRYAAGSRAHGHSR